MRNLKMLLLSRKFDIYSSRRLVEEAQHSHTIALWDPEWPLERCKFQADIILPRLGTFQFSQALKVLKAFEDKTAVVINSSQNYARARNKWLTFLELQKHHLPAPESYLLNIESTAQAPYPCIVKDLEASKGEGVYLVETKKQLLEHLALRGESALLQVAYPESFGTDVRAFVIGNRICAAMKRTARPGEFRSNLALGGTAEACVLNDIEEEIVLKTVQALQLQVSGVDLLRTRKGSLVLEANPCPGLEGIEKYTKVNLAKKIIHYAEELYEQTTR